MCLVALLTVLQFYLLEVVMPKFKNMFDGVHQYGGSVWDLASWAAWLGVIVILLFAAGWKWLALGQRYGWWAAGGDWPRLARGLILRRMLSGRATEGTLATAIGAVAPQLTVGLAAAAQRGDLAGVLDEAGWPEHTPAALDRALAADLLQRDRRKARLALGCRLAMPFLAGLPVCLIAMAVTTCLTTINRGMIDLASAHRNGSSTFQGGATPGMALLYWWGTCLRRPRRTRPAVHEDIHPEWWHVPQPKAPK